MERNLEKMGIEHYRATAPSITYRRNENRIIVTALMVGRTYRVECGRTTTTVQATSCDDACTKWLAKNGL